MDLSGINICSVANAADDKFSILSGIGNPCGCTHTDDGGGLEGSCGIHQISEVLMEHGRPSILVDLGLTPVEYFNVGGHFSKRSRSVPPQQIALF